MSLSRENINASRYSPLPLQNDDVELFTGHERPASFEDDHSIPLLKASANFIVDRQPESLQLPKLILYLSFALALLSAANVIILPVTLSKYRAYPFSESELESLPYGDARLGLERAAKMIPPPKLYHRSWPDKIARVSRKLKQAVWGEGVQVYITVEDSTVMRFPVPSSGSNACALSWTPPPESSARAKDVTIKGDVSEVEVWQLIAPSATSDTVYTNIEHLDYDALSYSSMPVRGELLGVLDLTVQPNSTTLEFACPRDTESLTVELMCQRVACHVSFMQIRMAPRLGFEVVRRRE